MLVCMRCQSAGTPELPAFCGFRCYFQKELVTLWKYQEEYVVPLKYSKMLGKLRWPPRGVHVSWKSVPWGSPSALFRLLWKGTAGGKNGCTISSLVLWASARGQPDTCSFWKGGDPGHGEMAA